MAEYAVLHVQATPDGDYFAALAVGDGRWNAPGDTAARAVLCAWESYTFAWSTVALMWDWAHMPGFTPTIPWPNRRAARQV